MIICSTDPCGGPGLRGFGEGWKVVLLIHTISQIWWSLLETKLTGTPSGQNRQRQIVPGGERQREISVNIFFFFFFFFFLGGQVEIVQSEKQHIVLTESFFISIAVEKGDDFESLFSLFFFPSFSQKQTKISNFSNTRQKKIVSFLAMEKVLSAILSIKNNFQDKRVVIGCDQTFLLRTEGLFFTNGN